MNAIVSTQSFTLFPQLPFELRLKIWEFVAPGPRVVAVQYKMSFPRDETDGKRHAKFNGWTSEDKAPAILSICQESRTEALKAYQRAFGSPFHDSKIYFDFSKDTLRFGKGVGEASQMDPTWRSSGPSDYHLDLFLCGGYHGGQDSEKVQFLSIDIDEEVYGRKSFCWDEIREFTALKELTMTSWEEDSMADRLMDVYRTTLAQVSRAYPQWRIPRITVYSAISRNSWGCLEVPA